MNRSTLLFVLFLFLVGVASACSTTTVSTRLKLPPRSLEMQTKQSILVLGFQGTRGVAASQAIRNAISKARFHTIIDGSFDQLRASQLSQRLQSGGTVDLTGSVPAGATVIISGGTMDDVYDHEIIEGETEKCAAKDKKGKCTRKVKVKVYTLKESCESTVNLRVTRVSDGAVLVDRTFAQSESNSESQEQRAPNSRQRQICDAAFNSSMNNAIPFVTPFEITVGLKFHDVDDPAGATKQAVSEMKMGQLDAAYKRFESVISVPGLDEKDRGWAHYNFAVALWAKALFDQCIEQVSEAQKYLGADSTVMEIKSACEDYIQ